MTALNDDETLLKVWAASKGVKIDERTVYDESVLEIYRSARGDTEINMRERQTGKDIMKAFCTLLYKKFFTQLNRKIKEPKTVGIKDDTETKSLIDFESEKTTAVAKTTTKIIRKTIQPADDHKFKIGDQTIQNYIGCGFFPIGFVTKLFIFVGENGAVYVPRMAKAGGQKVIAFARKIQMGYDFEKENIVKTEVAMQEVDETRQENAVPVE